MSDGTASLQAVPDAGVRLAKTGPVPSSVTQDAGTKARGPAQSLAGPVAGSHAAEPAQVLIARLALRRPDASAASRPSDGQAAPGKARAEGRAAGLGRVLAAVWAIGLLALLVRLAAGLAGAVRLTAQGMPLEGPAWRALLDQFLALVPLRRPIRLRSHPVVSVPMTWGWRRPVVLFPEGADEWSADERSSALYHELSHIKRADFLIMLLVRTSLAFFWWNPLCWIVYRELRKEQEIACDELALRAGLRPSTYAASLLAFRRSARLRWNPSAALLGMLGRTSLEDRLAAILKQKLTFMEVTMRTKIMIALTLVAAVAFIGTARPADGRETGAARTVLAETALPGAGPAAAALEAQAPAKTATEAKQEKAKEKEKVKEAEKAASEKTAVEKKIVVVGKDGGSSPIEITITEGDQVKKLRLDKTVTLSKDADGNVVIVTADGKEPIVVKGEPLRIEIQGGRLERIDEDEDLESGEPAHFKIIKDGGEKGDQVINYIGPDGKAHTVLIRPRPKVATGFSLTEDAEPEKGVAIVREKRMEGEPAGEWKIKEGRPAKTFAFSSETAEDMLAKVQELQKQVEAIKAKKMDLTALEESLKKLEAELKGQEVKFKTFEYKFDQEPGAIVLGKEVGEEQGKSVTVHVYGKEGKENREFRTVKDKATFEARVDGEGPISIVFVRSGLTRPDFDRATAELKKALPEGAKISDSDFDEHDGTMKFTIATPEGKKIDKDLVQKLVEIIGAAAKQK